MFNLNDLPEFWKADMTDRIMDIFIDEEYDAPDVRFVEVTVEKGFLISGIIVNDRYKNEKHVVDAVEEW